MNLLRRRQAGAVIAIPQLLNQPTLSVIQKLNLLENDAAHGKL